MPARREWTAQELASRLERRREQTREAVRRHRARRNGQVSPTAVSTTNEVTLTGLARKGAPNGTVSATPSQTFPVGEAIFQGEANAVEAILAPFESRGYVHDPRFWAKMLKKYPGVDLELEALKAADWLEEPRNAKRRCSKAFLDRWLAKASADCMAPIPFSGTRNGPPNGSPYGVYPGPPAAFQRNLERTYKAPEDFSPDELARSDAAREKVKELLPARLRGRWTR